MIESLTDIPAESLEHVLMCFAADLAADLPAWDPNILTDLGLRLPGFYRQRDGNWTLTANLPDDVGGQAVVIPPPGDLPVATDPAKAKAYDIDPANDPKLGIESPSVFTIYTNLKTTVSTLTAESIDQFFARQDSGHQKLLGIGAPVIAAAQKYGINASYIVAHAIVESGWGNSSIAASKKNLFGWNAFDIDPALADGFASFAQCINFVMGRVNALYLDPAGEWYNGGPYVGNKASGMNVQYAVESDWGTLIATVARQMGAKIDRDAAGVVAPAPAAPVASTHKVRGTRGEFVVNQQIPGNKLQIPHGNFSLIADDGTVLAAVPANTGGFYSDFRHQYGPIPPGSYGISNYRSPRNDEGAAMRNFDLSFSFSLSPQAGTDVHGRDGLDIHPDGPPPGTHGCIGLVAQSEDELKQFRDLLRAHTSGGSHLIVMVTYMAGSGIN